MKMRAVLVGGYNNRKLFYLLTPYGEAKLDGALVSADGKVEYIKFVQFITTTPNIKEYKFSKFHRFLWSPAPRNEDRNKWSRLFLSKTQPIDDELLVGTKIVTELGNSKSSKKSVADRADMFQRKIANPHGPHLEKTVLNRSFDNPLRQIIGLKALGPSLRANRSIDGDGDGFVNDGLPTMRPFIPGFDFSPDNFGPNSRMRSIRTNRADTIEDRSISREAMLRGVGDIADHVAVRHNGGKPIRTKTDALKVLASIIPSFARQDRGRSYIDFLDAMNQDNELFPWQQAYISQFVFMMEDEPLRNSVRWKIARLDPDLADTGVNGQTSAPRLTKSWKPISADLQIPGTPRRFRPAKSFDMPGIEVNYSQSETFDDITYWSWALQPDKRNYNVLSAAISKAMHRDLRKTANLADVQKVAPLVVGRRQEKLTALSQLFAQLPMPQGMPVNFAASLNEEIGQQLQQTIPMVINTVKAINSIDSSLLGFGPNDIHQMLLGGTIQESRDWLDLINMAIGVVKQRENVKNTIEAVRAVIRDWSPINQSYVGVHENTHALHFLRMRNELNRRASAIRNNYLEQLRQTLKKNGKDSPDSAILDRELPVESFYIDVFKENLASFARNNPTEFRKRLLYWSMPESSVLTRTQYENDGIMPRAGIDGMMQFYLPQLMNHDSALKAFIDGSGQNPGKALGLSGPISKQEAQEYFRDISAILDSPTYFGEQPVQMNEQIARLLNEIGAITKSRIGMDNKPGDNLTPYHVMTLLMPQLLSYEASSQRNDFRGVTFGSSSTTPSAFILDSFGYPDIKSPYARIDGLTSQEAEPISQALISMGPMMDRIHTSLAGLGPSPSQIDKIEAMTEQRNMPKPNEVLLPAQFANIGITTMDGFESADIETLIDAATSSVDAVGETWFSLSLIDANKFGTVGFFEMLPTAVLELSPFSDMEKEQLRQISGRIGLPASPGKILRNDAPGYSSYQATLTNQMTVLSSEGFSLAEFAAETGLSEILGIPLAQIATGGDITRQLTNEELQLVTRYMLWILGGRFPGDKLEAFGEVPR